MNPDITNLANLTSQPILLSAGITGRLTHPLHIYLEAAGPSSFSDTRARSVLSTEPSPGLGSSFTSTPFLLSSMHVFIDLLMLQQR